MGSPKRASTPKNQSTTMDPVMAKVGNHFAIWDILRGGNVLINNLHMIPRYQDSRGHSKICWTNIPCGCTYKDCSFKPQGGHSPWDQIADTFADGVCDKLGTEVMYIMNQEPGEHMAKKAKTAVGTATYLKAD